MSRHEQAPSGGARRGQQNSGNATGNRGGADVSTIPRRADDPRDRELRELDRIMRAPGLLTAPEVADG